MRILKVALIFMAALGLIVSTVHAAGDVAKGKALFNDPRFAGATAGKSCSSCHPDGKGLEKAGNKKEFRIMGKTQKSLEEAVNFCIEMALKGKAIDPKGADMVNLVSYIKSVAKKQATMPGY